MAQKEATKEVAKDAVKKELTMDFPDLNNGEYILRITDATDPSKVVCEFHIERNVFGWDKDTKTCESSRLIGKVYKPVNGEMTLVKRFRTCTKDETKMIWLGVDKKVEPLKLASASESC